MTHYTHYKDVPKSTWRWPNFTPYELSSKGNRSIIVDEAALDKLQRLRDIMGVPLVINSAYRDPAYNGKIGGTKYSLHTDGRAFDISTHGHDKHKLYEAAKEAGFTGFGFYATWIHVDTGSPRSWGLATCRKEFINPKE